MATTITKLSTSSITLTAGQWITVTGSGTYTIGVGLYNGRIVGIGGQAKIGPFTTDQIVSLCASGSDLVYFTQSPQSGIIPILVDPSSGTITDSASRSAVAEAASGGGGGSSVAVVSPESASRALVAADDSKTLICTGSLTFTVPSGLPSGFGLSAKGTCTFNPGSGATVNDIRTTGSLTPWCALIQTGSNSYDVVGGKA